MFELLLEFVSDVEISINDSGMCTAKGSSNRVSTKTPIYSLHSLLSEEKYGDSFVYLRLLRSYSVLSSILHTHRPLHSSQTHSIEARTALQTTLHHHTILN